MESSCSATSGTEQFAISDDRTPTLVAAMLASKGLEPVWKDLDEAILRKDEVKSVDDEMQITESPSSPAS